MITFKFFKRLLNNKCTREQLDCLELLKEQKDEIYDLLKNKVRDATGIKAYDAFCLVELFESVDGHIAYDNKINKSIYDYDMFIPLLLYKIGEDRTPEQRFMCIQFEDYDIENPIKIYRLPIEVSYPETNKGKPRIFALMYKDMVSVIRNYGVNIHVIKPDEEIYAFDYGKHYICEDVLNFVNDILFKKPYIVID